MNTKDMTQEQISAFADGELPDAQLELALAALRGPDGRAQWDLYHQIGDTLRSDDMAFNLSPGFTERLMMRLDEEPTIIAPANIQPQKEQEQATASVPVAVRSVKRLLLQGMAAITAVATMAFVATPQLMVATKETPTTTATTMLASASHSSPVSPKARIIAEQQGEVLRDSDIDEYLLAHQRFSPSVYSTAQYARSATFAIDSNK
jgi:sigma-E factor negative regulatory protein RseA